MVAGRGLRRPTAAAKHTDYRKLLVPHEHGAPDGIDVVPEQVVGGNTAQHHDLARGFDVRCAEKGATWKSPTGPDHRQGVVSAAHIGEPGFLFAPFQYLQSLVFLDAGGHILPAEHGTDSLGVLPCQGGGRAEPRHRVAQALRRRRMVMYREGVVLFVHLHEAMDPYGAAAAVPHRSGDRWMAQPVVVTVD